MAAATAPAAACALAMGLMDGVCNSFSSWVVVGSVGWLSACVLDAGDCYYRHAVVACVVPLVGVLILDGFRSASPYCRAHCVPRL